MSRVSEHLRKKRTQDVHVADWDMTVTARRLTAEELSRCAEAGKSDKEITAWLIRYAVVDDQGVHVLDDDDVPALLEDGPVYATLASAVVPLNVLDGAKKNSTPTPSSA